LFWVAALPQPSLSSSAGRVSTVPALVEEEVLNTEDIASRFTRVFIASGDHLFEPAARRLISQGVDVRIVARPTSVALSLWALGRNIEFPETAVVQEIA